MQTVTATFWAFYSISIRYKYPDQGCARLIFFRADSTLTHMTIQVTQVRLNSNPKFANLTKLRLN